MFLHMLDSLRGIALIFSPVPPQTLMLLSVNLKTLLLLLQQLMQMCSIKTNQPDVSARMYFLRQLNILAAP